MRRPRPAGRGRLMSGSLRQDSQAATGDEPSPVTTTSPPSSRTRLTISSITSGTASAAVPQSGQQVSASRLSVPHRPHSYPGTSPSAGTIRVDTTPALTAARHAGSPTSAVPAGWQAAISAASRRACRSAHRATTGAARSRTRAAVSARGSAVKLPATASRTAGGARRAAAQRRPRGPPMTSGRGSLPRMIQANCAAASSTWRSTGHPGAFHVVSRHGKQPQPLLVHHGHLESRAALPGEQQRPDVRPDAQHPSLRQRDTAAGWPRAGRSPRRRRRPPCARASHGRTRPAFPAPGPWPAAPPPGRWPPRPPR